MSKTCMYQLEVFAPGVAEPFMRHSCGKPATAKMLGGYLCQAHADAFKLRHPELEQKPYKARKVPA